MGQHPNREAVLEIIESFLAKRLFRGWRVDGLHYDFQTGAYDLICTNSEITVRVRLMQEWIEEASRRRIRHALKDAFKIDAPDEDNAF